jgi:hypothetical protein
MNFNLVSLIQNKAAVHQLAGKKHAREVWKQQLPLYVFK